MKKEILVIAAPHGNETLGSRLFIYLLKNHPDLLDHIDIVVGNPRAVIDGVRYLDTDLNRSYASYTDEGYEKMRANEIRKYINSSNASLILDMHTTRVAEPPCFIADCMTGEVGKFMAASHIENIVGMPRALSEPSLIGNFSQAVSIEVSEATIDDALLKSLTADIRNYLNSKYPNVTKQLFTIVGKISKQKYIDTPLDAFQNFVPSKFGFIPILMGENSYRTDPSKDYLGFYADKQVALVLEPNHMK